MSTRVVCDNTLTLDVSPFDTCDRCGPSVSAAVSVHGLTFCAHCARTKAGLVDFYIIDQYKTPDPEPVSDGSCTAESAPPDWVWQ